MDRPAKPFLLARRAAKVDCPRCFAPAGKPCRRVEEFHAERVVAGLAASKARQVKLKKQRSASISIRGETYAALSRRAAEIGKSPDSITEQLVSTWLDGAGAP